MKMDFRLRGNDVDACGNDIALSGGEMKMDFRLRGNDVDACGNDIALSGNISSSS